MASAGNPKEKVTTEENKSLSQRAQRSNADFSLCFFLCLLRGYFFYIS